jgi:AcrR family transcriptional regulator
MSALTSSESAVAVAESAARPGRRRDPGLDDAIIDAALALFVEGGYRGVTIEGVAARAGVGKATVYRRHPTSAALLVEAARIRLCLLHDLPDTGDLRADLVSLL